MQALRAHDEEEDAAAELDGTHRRMNVGERARNLFLYLNLLFSVRKSNKVTKQT